MLSICVEVILRQVAVREQQVSAGGCNGCEVEANALGNVVFDSSRFGIEFVASPRHADGILVTGPVTANMREALLNTYEAVAEPKIVIASGARAISGGIFKNHAEVSNGTGDLLTVDLYVSGCPRILIRFSMGCCDCSADTEEFRHQKTGGIASASRSHRRKRPSLRRMRSGPSNAVEHLDDIIREAKEKINDPDA